MDHSQQVAWPLPHAPNSPAGAPSLLPVALLRHELPDGGAHFDLLVAVRTPTSQEDACACCWRCAAPADALQPGEETPAERISDHRALYLTLQAPRTLSGGRGRVFPLARGHWTRAGEDDHMLVRWSDGRESTLQIISGRLRCVAAERQ